MAKEFTNIECYKVDVDVNSGAAEAAGIAAMPTFNLSTNVPGDRVSASQIVADLSKAVAKATGKPESYVLVSLTTDKPMMFGGTEEPCAFGELISIGVRQGLQRPLACLLACSGLPSTLGQHE